MSIVKVGSRERREGVRFAAWAVEEEGAAAAAEGPAAATDPSSAVVEGTGAAAVWWSRSSESETVSFDLTLTSKLKDGERVREEGGRRGVSVHR